MNGKAAVEARRTQSFGVAPLLIGNRQALMDHMSAVPIWLPACLRPASLCQGWCCSERGAGGWWWVGGEVWGWTCPPSWPLLGVSWSHSGRLAAPLPCDGGSELLCHTGGKVMRDFDCLPWLVAFGSGSDTKHAAVIDIQTSKNHLKSTLFYTFYCFVYVCDVPYCAIFVLIPVIILFLHLNVMLWFR